MSAAKTGLPKYASSNGFAYAAKVKAIEPFPLVAGAKTLTFDGTEKRVNLIPDWIATNNPSVGGYFVVEDFHGNTVCRFIDNATFTAQFSLA